MQTSLYEIRFLTCSNVIFKVQTRRFSLLKVNTFEAIFSRIKLVTFSEVAALWQPRFESDTSHNFKILIGRKKKGAKFPAFTLADILITA